MRYRELLPLKAQGAASGKKKAAPLSRQILRPQRRNRPGRAPGRGQRDTRQTRISHASARQARSRGAKAFSGRPTATSGGARRGDDRRAAGRDHHQDGDHVRRAEGVCAAPGRATGRCQRLSGNRGAQARASAEIRGPAGSTTCTRSSSSACSDGARESQSGRRRASPAPSSHTACREIAGIPGTM